MRLTKETKDFFKPDVNKSKFCVEADMSRTTLLNRLDKPGTFKAEEVQIIKKMTGLKEIFEY